MVVHLDCLIKMILPRDSRCEIVGDAEEEPRAKLARSCVSAGRMPAVNEAAETPQSTLILSMRGEKVAAVNVGREELPCGHRCDRVLAC
jgi:hypothetical protein